MLCRFAVIGSACESSCARLLLCCSCSPVRLHGLHLDLEDISMPFLHHFSIPASKGGDCMLAVPLCAWERAVGGGSDLSKQSRPGHPFFVVLEQFQEKQVGRSVYCEPSH
uniref:Uncharacterized protein n=1 Tax=Setaria viridis TaxID=4556 RepID=A0A4U6WAT3_SETVI|nr:hypothetical protein SEVIR_1G184666v2 [Setaria viridis]TKW39516.1 hypothetical protein SEVIR_1G184666v2 [Setaria viridis]